MAKRQGIERRNQAGPAPGPTPRVGANTLKLAMLIGALAVLGIAFANQRQIGRMDERLSARLSQFEARLVPDSVAPLEPFSQQSLSTPAEPGSQLEARNPTVSALVGIRPTHERPDPNLVYPFEIKGAPLRGSPDAPVTIVEFSDFECSMCRRAQPTLKRILDVYGDQVRLVWKHLPLSMHKDAPLAHIASVAADKQGKFWEFHEQLFADQKLKIDDLRRYALNLGLQMQEFEEGLSDPQIHQVVEADMAEAVALPLTGSPGFFVNGRYIRGAKPFEVFAEVINDELTKLGLPIPEAARVEPESEVVE